jgi:hypothetical protein
VKKPTEEARARVIDGIQTQSKRDRLTLSETQWRLLNDHEEHALSPAELGPLLEKIEDEEDDVLELLFRYEQALPEEEKPSFREAVALTAKRNEYLGGLLSYVEFDEPKPKLPRWADQMLLLLTGIALVSALVAFMLFFPPIDEERLPAWWRSSSHDRFWSESPFMVWLGRAVILAPFAYAIQFFGTKIWRAMRERKEKSEPDGWN